MSKEKTSKVPAILLIVGSIIGLFLWLVILFYAFLLGGSPGPDYERTVPYSYANIMWLGFIGAVVGLVGGVKSTRGTKLATRIMIIIAALLGAAGSIALFLIDLAPVGVFYCLVGVAPPAVYFFLAGILDRKEQT